MDNPVVVVLLTLVAVAVIKLLLLLAWGGGSLARFGTALQAFRRVMGDAKMAEKVKPLLGPPEPEKPKKLSGEPLRLLALLQREGRVLDFFLEDVQAASDEQLGAGVRELHRKAQAVIKEHLVLEPVLPGQEDESVEVRPGFDPGAVRLTGNVTGQPPFKGTLKHHGWRVKEYKLAPPPEGQDELVVAPAEVDLP
jgi:hypothetical protein